MHECSISFWCCSRKYTDGVTRAEIAAESVRYCYRRRDRTSGGGTSAVSRHLGLHGAIYRYATLAVSAARGMSVMPELRSSETVCVQNYTYERSRGQFVVSVPPRVGYRFYARSIAAVCHRRQRQDFWGTRVQYLVSVPHGAVYRRLHECSISL